LQVAAGIANPDAVVPAEAIVVEFICESEMVLFPECTESCAQKVVDTADIVRDAIFRQPFGWLPG
jgi:hypothetical protein